ncbi:MAG: hypothetical protein FWH20_00040 [Oscillospiraceae bacterium]|nr:hypothetical protein [Oscillospiraceae bacterium]
MLKLVVKIISILVIVAILSSCGAKSPSVDDDNSSGFTASDPDNPSNFTPQNPDNSSEFTPQNPDNPNSFTDPESDNPSGFTDPNSDNSSEFTPQNPDNPQSFTAAELAQIILESVDFPVMTRHETQDDIEVFVPGIDFEAIAEIACYQQALTVHLAEIIVIRPQPGELNAIMDFLRTRQSKLKDELAFYPLQQTAADAMKVGNKNGYAYLICHENAPTAEKVLLAYIE